MRYDRGEAGVRIGIVASHQWPIPTPVHTGDIVILDLAIALTNLGHTVTMFAPEGTQAPGQLCVMQAALGSSMPTARECEVGCYWDHSDELFAQDIVHDFSTEKHISEMLGAEGRPVLQTLLGGRWLRPNPPRNLCVFSEAHRGRVIRGETDYHGTPAPDMAGPNGRGVADAHVVYGGVDTSFYTPGLEPKGSHWLWLGRWHPVRGYKMAIDVARATGIELVMCGEDPQHMRWDSEKAFAAEAVEYAQGLPNVRFEYLPPDPDHHTAKREQYRRAKALLLPTQFQEPFGLQQVEAMACGTPMLSTNYGSMPELGLAVRTANDVAAFVKAVNRANGSGLFLEPAECRADALDRFDRHVMASNYLKEYEAVIGGARW